MPKIYKNTKFAKWQTKNNIPDSSLIKAISEIENGLIDAELGGGLFKKRIAKSGFGKSGSYRTIIASKQTIGWIFIFGFNKNEVDNIDKSTLNAYKEYARIVLFPNVVNLVKSNLIIEVKNE